MSHKVRRLGPDDIAAMRALNTLFEREFDDPESYGRHPPSDDYLETRLAKPHIIALIAEGDGVLGGLVAHQLDKLEQERGEIYLYDLAVAEPYRRQGIATSLIAELQGIADAQGAWVIFVQADHGDDPAIALYTKLGTREDVMHFDIDPSRIR
jgi:aminoglycoside 3-N-acetyltransferase I